MKTGSLFTGYGGLDQAAHAIFGGRLAWVSDNHPSAVKLLAHRHPGVPNLGDITAIDWTAVEPVDLLTAGFPCQDISNAGQRAGIEGERSGLWSHVADAVRVLRPRHVLLENVAALLVRGHGRVAADLAALGYDLRWVCLRASDIGAPHRRDRWFSYATPSDAQGHGRHEGWTESARLIGRPHPAISSGTTAADTNASGLGTDQRNVRAGKPDAGWRATADSDSAGRQGAEPTGRHVLPARGAVADAHGGGQPGQSERDRDPVRAGQGEQRLDPDGRLLDWGQFDPAIRRWEAVLGRPAPEPTEPGSRSNRVLSPRFVEWLMGLPAGWVTDVPGLSRTEQLRLLGNGVVPQQGEAAFRYLLTLGAPARAA